MARNGLIALVILVVLFVALSELVGGEEDAGVLSRIAGSPAGETARDARSENAGAAQVASESPGMLDEVPPETADEDFGSPVEDEDLAGDDGLIDPAGGYAPDADIDPAGIPAELENGPSGGHAANSPGSSGSRTNRKLKTASSNEALLRDLAKAGVIDDTRKRR